MTKGFSICNCAASGVINSCSLHVRNHVVPLCTTPYWMKLAMAACFTVFATISFAEDASDVEAAKDTIAQINHINWVVSKIKTYNSTLVLEEEYKQISPDKMNLNRIPDEEVLGQIKSMLDLLHGMIKDEREMKHWKQCYESRRKREQLEFWKSHCEIPNDMLGGLSLGSMASGWTAMAAGWSAVYSLSKSAVNVYRDYDDFVQNLENEALQKKFEFETAKLDRLHELNKDLLQAQWEMIREYHFDDSLRVSDSDISIFIEALKDPDHNRVFSKIEAMKDKFLVFPVYWYYLSSVALEIGNTSEALAACNKFFEVNRGLFRDDPMIGAVAMNKAFLLPKDKDHKEEIRALLELIRKHNAGIVDWRKDYFCAVLYSSYLGDNDSAVKVLKHAMSTLEYSVSEHLHELVEPPEKSEIESSNIEFSDGESLWLCRKLMLEISSESVKCDEKELKKFCERETASSIDKLAYVGKMSWSRVWTAIGADVVEVSLCTGNRYSWSGVDNEVSATIPIRWLLAGEIVMKIGVEKGGKIVKTFGENRERRSMAADRKVTIVFDVPRENLKGADALHLCFNHPDYPADLTFASATAYKNGGKASAPGTVINNLDFNEESSLDNFRLMVADFKGRKYCFAGEGKDFVLNGSWSGIFKTAFPHLKEYKTGIVPVGTNGIDVVEFRDDGSVQIRYKNTGDEKVKPAISVYQLNKYGAVIRRIDDIWNFSWLNPGETSKTKWIKGAANPVYYDIETSTQWLPAKMNSK